MVGSSSMWRSGRVTSSLWWWWLTASVSVILLLLLPGWVEGDNTLEFVVEENLPAGRTVGFIAGSGRRGLDLTLVSRGAAFDEDILVDRDTGHIRTKVPLDRERRSSYSLVAIPPSGDNTMVLIKVRDVNDNAPRFAVHSMNTSFSENTPRTVKRTLVPARDPDLGHFSTQSYRIVSGNENEAFALSPHRGRDSVLYLDLQINRILDRETTPFYALVIEAADGGSPPMKDTMQLNITIEDVNDNQPIFSQSRYSATIPENTTIGTVVHKVLATDTDQGRNSEITYSINRRQSDRNSLFRVGAKSGEIIVNHPLDFETKMVHELIVVARDNGTQPLDTSAFVSITVQNINDNLPNINIIFLSDDASPKISEDAKAGDFVARISVNDPDTQLEYDSLDDVTLAGGGDTFKLEKHDNVIYLMVVARPLDREHQPSYNLTVTARDRGRPPLQASRSFMLRVIDTNDNAPHFEQQLYTAQLSETAEPGTEVIQVTASDRDEGGNSQLRYSLVDGDSDDSSWFSIDATSGRITTRARVDCETDSAPIITVVVSDSGTPTLSSSASVQVTIVDVNDNEPVFDQSFYNVSVLEDRPVGYCILNVSASDPDCGVNGQVTYSLGSSSSLPISHGSDLDVWQRAAPKTTTSSKSITDHFSINNVTGSVCLVASLDRELRGYYELPVLATDRGGLSSTAILKVQIADVNDNRPVFYPRHYNVSVSAAPPSSSTDRVVATVQASDRDLGHYGQVTYRLTSGNDLALFKIDPRSGQVSSVGWLGSAGRQHLLRVTAVDGGGLNARRDAHVLINVVDLKRRAPTFTRRHYAFSVAENSPRGHAVGAVYAVAAGGDFSAASGTGVQYSIFSGDPDGVFTIGETSGHVTVSGHLDRELHDSYRLNIQAASGYPPIYAHTQVNVSVTDVNDEPPQFAAPSVVVSLSEATPVGTQVFTARAHDADSVAANGRIVYRLLPSTDTTTEQVFSVHPVSGALILRRLLDRELRQSYRLLVEAQDEGEPPLSSSLAVLVRVTDENDNSPRFLPPNSTSTSTSHVQQVVYEASVREDRPANWRLLRLKAFDADAGNNGRVSFRLLEDDQAALFAVSPDSGWLRLRRRLDHERASTHRLVVTASDHGTPPRAAQAHVVVHVLNANDHRPVFARATYRLRVAEARPAGVHVGRVTAADADRAQERGESGVVYQLRGANHTFNIDSVSGEISTLRELDREETELYHLTVVATDNGSPPQQTSVPVQVQVLDENDCAPRFVEPSPEGAGVDDTDTVTVVVSVREERPAGFDVVQMVATDDDLGANGTVSYSLAKGVGDEATAAFVIDANTGIVSTTRVLDHEVRSVYHLTVVARDGGSPARQTSRDLSVQVLDLNDNSPVFTTSSLSFNIVENTAIGHEVGRVVATDRDAGENGRVAYTILSGNTNNMFDINRSSGVLYTTQQVDYEMASSYTLHIEAVDSSAVNPQTGRVSVLISVTDVNDNTPKFDQQDPLLLSVAESTPVGRSVWNLTAVDADTGPAGVVTYSISQQLPESAFSIDADSGSLRVRRPLDYERHSEYTVVVTASDLPHSTSGDLTDPSGDGRTHADRLSSSITARIIIGDVNDNAPRFVRVGGRAVDASGQLTDVDVRADAQTGDAATHVVAVDRDSRDNGRITYTLNSVTEIAPASENTEDSPPSRLFEIDPQTGLLRVARPLLRATGRRFAVNISALDHGRPSLSASVLVRVHVTATDATQPVFTARHYRATIAEDAPVNSKLDVRVSAAVSGSGGGGVVRYRIPAGLANNTFSVNAETGQLITTRPLDRETTATYLLTVLAFNPAVADKYDAATLVVHVLDVNDNAPELQHGCYALHIPENSQEAVVHTISASDGDDGDNARVEYSITDGNIGNRFSIDSVSGAITARPLDRELRAIYRLEVTASDSGVLSRRRATCHVPVHVLDDNDNEPQFETRHYQARVSERAVLGELVTTVRAVDIDSGDNARVSYSLNNETHWLFRIDKDSGRITTAGSLNRERGQRYVFDVRATDSGRYRVHSTLARVTVVIDDINDHAPMFDTHPYQATVPQLARAAHVLVTVAASDEDSGSNAAVQYSIVNAEDRDKFSIDSHSGEFRMRLNYQQYRSDALYSVQVRATDRGSPPLSSDGVVHVYFGQSAHQTRLLFDKTVYRAAIAENTAAGTHVVKISAYSSDARQKRVRYHVVSGNERGWLSVEPDSGQVYVAPSSGAVSLPDYEQTRSLRLIVRAESVDDTAVQHGFASVLVELLDVNDNQPHFTQDTYSSSVREGHKRGTFVVQVSATDDDVTAGSGSLFYSIVDGNVDSAFVLESARSGVIRSNVVLDREIRQSYQLTVTASDSGSPPLVGTCSVLIKVIDENDNRPTFPPHAVVEIDEAAPLGLVAVTVTANDVDTHPPLVYSLAHKPTTSLSGRDQGPFAIDRFTGRITLRSPLDRETQEQYVLTVRASDSSHEAVTNVSVLVRDNNDHAPLFSQAFYQQTILDNSAPGVEVLRLSGEDADTGQNGLLRYSLLSTNQHFTVEPSSGRILTTAAAGQVSAGARGRLVQLVAAVKDSAAPFRQTAVAVQLRVERANMHAPSFEKQAYRASVSEDVIPGTVIARVSARDPDTADQPADNNYNSGDYQHDAGQSLYYSLMNDDNTEHAFLISSGSGEVVVARSLDRERRGRYVLQVMARDRGVPRLNSTVQLVIDVTDINDNAPVFNQSVYLTNASEALKVDALVTHVAAHDKDLHASSTVVYDITSGNQLDTFRLDGRTGELRLQRRLDYDLRRDYRLIVRASDAAGVGVSSLAIVHVNVVDENDNAPAFPQPVYDQLVVENSPVGTLVFTARATDADDDGRYGRLRYSLTADGDSRWFRVEPASGAVRTAAVLDAERRQTYQFTVAAHDAGGRSGEALVRVNVQGVDEFAPRFARAVFTLACPTDAPAGFVCGRVEASDADRGVDGVVLYRLAEPHRFLAVNRTGGHVIVLRDLSELLRETGADTIGRDLHRRTRRQTQTTAGVGGSDLSAPPAQLLTEQLTVVASSGRVDSRSASAVVYVRLDPSLNGQHALAATDAAGLADWGVGLLVVALLVAAAFVAAFLFLHVRSRRVAKPRLPSASAGALSASVATSLDPHATAYSNGNRAVATAAEHLHHYPPRYSEIQHAYDTADGSGCGAAAVMRHGASCEFSANSQRSASSGRGSAEDEEIRMINEAPLLRHKCLIGRLSGGADAAAGDSGGSDGSAHNTQQYLARLGIDTSRHQPQLDDEDAAVKLTSSGGGGGDMPAAAALRSLDVGGVDVLAATSAMAGSFDISHLLCSKLSAAGVQEDNAIMDGTRAFCLDDAAAAVAAANTSAAALAHASVNGSLSSIVHSEDELTGSYNWDYLLNWGPQYQPLAHVFSEIARLKDDSAPSPYAVSAPPPPPPPPLLTGVRGPAGGSSVAAMTLTPSRLPQRSPVVHDLLVSHAMSPSFSPALSPLDAGCPSINSPSRVAQLPPPPPPSAGAPGRHVHHHQQQSQHHLVL